MQYRVGRMQYKCKYKTSKGLTIEQNRNIVMVMRLKNKPLMFSSWMHRDGCYDGNLRCGEIECKIIVKQKLLRMALLGKRCKQPNLF